MNISANKFKNANKDEQLCQLSNLYIEENYSVRQIGRLLNLESNVVIQYLQSGGIVRKRKISNKKLDLTGQVFGDLVVIEFSHVDDKHQRRWICRCKCNTIILVPTRELLKGKQKSCKECGIKRMVLIKGDGKNHHAWKGFVNDFAEMPYNFIHKTGIFTASAKRGVEVKITPKDIFDLWTKSNICALSGQKLYIAKSKNDTLLTTASVDRIDSDKGYEIGNIQFVHKDINWMKNDYSQNYFLSMMKLVAYPICTKNEGFDIVRPDKSKRYSGYGNVSGRYLSEIKKRARNSNLIVEITAEDIWKVYLAQSGLCNITKLPINFPLTTHGKGTASVDRIDNKIGYTKSNIQIVHKDINFMRWCYDLEYFKLQAKLITDYQTASTIIAAPCPPPIQQAQIAYF